MNSIIVRLLGVLFVVLLASFVVKSVFWIALVAVLGFAGYNVYKNGVSVTIAKVISFFTGK